MPDNSPPQIPNYVPGVGALVTYRSQFEEHIAGADFRQVAQTIDVLLENNPPGLEVDGQYYTNVLTALQALAAAAEPPVIALATQSAPGIIQLTRDLGGANGLTPIVIGLQGRSVSSQQPTAGQVLTWNGSFWVPQAVATFVPGADLGGAVPVSSNTLQYVSNLSGDSGMVGVTANSLMWASSATPFIGQKSITSSEDSTIFAITGQTNFGSGQAGSLILAGGNNIGGGLPGGTILGVQGSVIFQVGSVITGQTVASFFASAGLTSTQMPANTGNRVIYIANATTPPSTGTPVGGAILYGSNGQLWIKQSDSTTFQIGSIPDPSNWTSVAPSALPAAPTIPTNGTLTYNVVATSSVSAPVDCFTFAMPVNTSCRFDTIYVAKETATGNTAQYNYSIGFIRTGSNPPIAIGSITSSDPRSIGSSWIAPTTTTGSYISGSNIVIPTGSSSATSAVWTVVTQVVITTA
jgi:hypothetical protein